jgi:predicted transcriptional regulator
MAYKLMKTLIKRPNADKEVLTKKANVYYAAGQLTDEQYQEIMDLINNLI